MSNEQPPKPPMPPNNRPPTPRFARGILGWVLLFVAGVLLVSLLSENLKAGKEISLSAFWQYVHNNQLTGEIKIENNRVSAELAKGTPGLSVDANPKIYTYFTLQEEDFVPRLQKALNEAGSKVEVVIVPESWFSSIPVFTIVFMGLLLVFWIFMIRRMSAGAGGGGFLGNFGRSRHRMMNKEQSHITFSDVAGIDDAKEEVQEIVEFLKNPKKFSRLGGRVPRGVLLIGQPGCGKTMLAKAIAGEADAPFFSISGSDFVEMFVGVGASRVRDLFKQAKSSSPCIIFLDEIDAVGRKRGVGFSGGGHDEREQTLNAILVEMDGFDSSDQVIVIAATNRADVLDPALTRPGRFDRQITVPLPDLKGRLEILRIYANKVKISDDVDLQRIARGTPMFSGADLAALVNEAAIAAAMQNKDRVEQADLEEARDKVRWGRSRKSSRVDEDERRITAYHEAGHALIQDLLPEADPLHKVSIIPRGQAGGATFALPERDRNLYTLNYCKALLQVTLGGRLAEELFCNDISSGASADIAQATSIARHMVVDWGMSKEIGFVRYVDDEDKFFAGRDFSEKTAEIIDREVRRFIDESENLSRKLLEQHRDAVERVAQALLKYETLSADDVRRLINGETLDKPTVDELLAAEGLKTQPLADLLPGEDLAAPDPDASIHPPAPELG